MSFMQLDMLAESDWLQATPSAFSDAILKAVRLREFEPGEAVYELGGPPGGIYGVVSGAVQIIVDGGDEAVLPGHVATPGAWFGEGPVLTRMPRLVGAASLRKSVLAYAGLQQIEAIVVRDPGAWRWLGVLAVINLGVSVAGGSDLMLRRPRDRCIAGLLRLAGCRFRGDGPHEAVVSHSDLASLCNLSRSVVSGFLKELEAEGQIAKGYGRIVISDPARLRASVSGNAGSRQEIR